MLGGSSEPRKATLVINFIHKSEREASQKDLQLRIGAMLADQPDIRYWFLKDNGQRDLSLIVAGPDIDVINDTANQIASEMRGIPIIENPMSTAELERPELRVEPKRQVAADLGVSTEALSETIRVATMGDIDANLAKFNAGDRLVPIRVELDEAARSHVGLLQELVRPNRTLRGDNRAEAAGYGQVMRAIMLRRADGAHDPVADQLDIIAVAQPGAQQHEFVSAEARHGVDGAHQPGQAAGHLLQKLIARCMPQ